MIKIVKFMFIALFLISFFPGCKPADKIMPKEPLKATDKITSGEFPLAPEFKLNDLGGNEVSLSSYKDKKAVVLIFWTTWCPYCRIVLNSLKEDVSSLKNMGVELLAINIGEPKSKVDDFAERYSLNFKVLLDQDYRVSYSYDLLGVPTYFVINQAGQVVFSGNRFPKEELKELTAG